MNRTGVGSLQIQIKTTTCKFPCRYFVVPEAQQDLACFASGWLNQIYILSYHIRQNQMKMIQLPAENVCVLTWLRGTTLWKLFGLFIPICFQV